ncbi:nucleotidyltransferase domain-containing protein [Agromyces aurantiacus]|uniref:Nucleotidyltransferase domain-containing protein n=1 Tax=Agromyces aurantiacus TaxID=165814 RepID=A0ABV9R198_9MICO|nr:nucleotidyltransferase domain-containing protein [Agromyces aurantiacus]MBM7505905.1 putative nucleotidyltransferase [Agromyces aurantiacus]
MEDAARRLTAPAVVPVAEARAGLSSILRDFRARGKDAGTVVIGSHRRPEAVLLPYEAFTSLSSADAGAHASTLELLRRRKPLIERLARANRIRSVFVFGSVGRGEETAESDVDLLVDPEPDASLFDLAQFELDLEALLDRPVDVVSRRSLDPERDRAVLHEAVEL